MLIVQCNVPVPEVEQMSNTIRASNCNVINTQQLELICHRAAERSATSVNICAVNLKGSGCVLSGFQAAMMYHACGNEIDAQAGDDVRTLDVILG